MLFHLFGKCFLLSKCFRFNMKLVNFSFFLLPFIFFTLTLNGQNRVSNTTKTKDKRFITQVNASQLEIKLNDSSGLVKEITLGIEWWTLLDEPIEKYLFRWKKGISVFSEDHTIYLSESKLKKYPDLLKRFKQLKPNYINLIIETWLNYNDIYSLSNQSLFKSLPSCLRKSTYASISGKTVYELKNNIGTRTINSNGHFYISTSGKTGDDISPGSAKDWTQFIKYSCPIDNRTGLNLFKHSNSASFSIKVTEIKVPEREINAIAKEYLKRENKKKLKKKEKTKKEKIESKKTNSWDDLNKNSNNSWSDLDDKNSDWDTNIKKDKNSNWDTKKNDDKKSINHKIIFKNNKSGIIDKKTNKVLIPYKKWVIKKYYPEDKMASVELNSDEKTIVVSCDRDGEIYITTRLTGKVDSFGKWIIPPIKSYYISRSYKKLAWYGLVISTNTGNYKKDQERDRKYKIKQEKLREKDKKCLARLRKEFNKQVNIYKTKGKVYGSF